MIAPLPITQSIIDQVTSLAVKDNMPTGLKILTRTGVTLFDSSWTVGVDCTVEDEDDENENEKSSEEEINNDYDINNDNYNEIDNDDDNDHE